MSVRHALAHAADGRRSNDESPSGPVGEEGCVFRERLAGLHAVWRKYYGGMSSSSAEKTVVRPPPQIPRSVQVVNSPLRDDPVRAWTAMLLLVLASTVAHETHIVIATISQPIKAVRV